jgi:hypothetical protein
MKQQEIIGRAYDLFASFGRPTLFTRLSENDDDPECRDHDSSLQGASVHTLSISQIGSSGYSPVPQLTPQAMAYFLPRLIEFAVRNVNDSDDDPFVVRFIDSTLNGPNHKQFKLLNEKQREVVYQTLLYVKRNYSNLIEESCADKDLEMALNKWNE